MKKSSEQVLLPKITPPLIQKNVIPRPELLARLNDASSKRFVLVSAPAGYGKTCLINSWLRDQEPLVAWDTLDETDNKPSLFFANLCSSIQTCCPGIEMDEALFQFNDDPSETGLFALINFLHENISDGILVLDDYHNIRNPLIHRFLQQLINMRNIADLHPSAEEIGLLPVLITRTDPPFPLSRWRIQNEIIEIRADDLVFSVAEGEQFFQQSAITTLSEAQIGSILRKTEGWIAGLQLAAISFHEQYHNDVNAFMSGFSGCNPLIADYLMNEVVSSLPAPLQKFLYETSILEMMSGALCDEITGSQNSQEILEYLDKSNLFVINFDYQKNWYRYHRLLADFLQKTDQIDGADRLQRHERAAKWFEKHDFYEESIRHYISAQQMDAAVRIVTEIALSLLSVGKNHQLKSLLDLFQESDFALWPWLSIYRAWLCVILESGFEEFWLEKAEKAIRQNEETKPYSPVEIDEMKGNILAIRLFGAAKKGESQTVEKYLTLARGLITEENKLTHGVLNFTKGIICFNQGAMGQAREFFFPSKQEFLSGRMISPAGEVLGLMGESYYIQGNLSNAEKYFREAISLQKLEQHEISSLDRSFSGLGQVLFEWNRIEDAFANMIKGYHYGKSSGTSAQIFSGLVLAGSYINISELDNAQEILEEIEDLPRYHELQPFVESLGVSCHLRYYCARKDLRKAQKLIDNRNILKIDDADTVRVPEKMALIRYFLTIHEPDRVISLVDQVSVNVGKRGRIGKFIRLLVHQSVAYNARGNHDMALKRIIQALELGKEDGFIQRFIDYDYTILPDLVEISQMDPKSLPPSFDLPYVKEIIRVLYQQELSRQSDPPLSQKDKPENSASPVLILEHPLTLQEEKILQLLISGYDNFQIAAIQHITINTVKSHISHIFNKLRVHNRVQAANRAKILGLAR
jgi:LuxR family maltose regulon positive regulatory protein